MKILRITAVLSALFANAAVAAPTAAPELDGQTVYQVLLGEVALQRGAADLAAASYAEAAKRTGDPAILMRAVQIAASAQRFELALELNNRWIELAPENRHARQTLIGILAALGRFPEIAPHLRYVLETDAAGLPGNLLQLTRLLSWGQDREAIRRLVEQVTEPYREIPEAQYALGQAAKAAGKNEQALAAARKAQALRSDWPAPVLLEVQVLGREAAGEAIEVLGRFLERNPGASEARLQRARLLAAERKWDDARRDFERVAGESADPATALYPLAMIAAQQHDYAAAEKYFSKLLETAFSDRALVFYQLGVLADERKDFAAALAYLEQVEGGEYYVVSRARMAQIMAKQGRYAEARAFLAKVEAREPQDKARLVVTEAQIVRDQRDFQGAFDLLDMALKRQPNEPDLLYEQAMVAERLNRTDVLEANLNRVITLRPDNAHAYNALGYSLADRNIRLEEARRLIAKALELAPEDPFILDSMGWVLYRLGLPDDALVHLERAYRMRQDPEIAAHLGEVLWSAGRRDDARRLWKEARQQNPDNEVLGAVIQKYAP